MQKREDSTRSLGMASLGTDIPTRDKIKAAAAAAGMPVSEYLRYLADLAVKDQQGVMLSSPLPAAGVVGMLKAVMAKLDAWENPPVKRSITTDLKTLDANFWHALGLNSTPEDIALVKKALAEYKQRHPGQLEMEYADA